MTTTAQTFQIETLNRADGSVDGHRAGCADIARIAKKERLDRSGSWDVSSKKQAWEDYNADFIAECEADDPSQCDHEAHCYEINWLPCANHVPATADDASTTQKENDMSTTATTPKAAHAVVRTYDTADSSLLTSALTVTCPIPYCAATPGNSCTSAKGKDVQPHTKRVQRANKPVKAPQDRKPATTKKAAATKPAAKPAPKPEPKPEPEPLPICKPCLTRHHKSCKGTTEAPCGCESAVHAA